MDISIFLARALGLYLLIISIAMLVHIKFFKNLITDVINNSALLFISGIIALILGILLILSHNVWQNDWRVLITILAWLTFLKGIMRTVFPKVALSMMKKFLKRDSVYYTSAIISLLVGIFLCYHGFLSLFRT